MSELQKAFGLGQINTALQTAVGKAHGKARPSDYEDKFKDIL